MNEGNTILIGRYPISIGMACLMHYIWSIGLFLDPSAVNATAVHTVLVVAHEPIFASLIFGMVAFLASLGIAMRTMYARVWLILPQQVVLWFSVVGAVRAMYLGQFADGVERSHWFLMVDQIPVVLIALGHTIALLLIAEESHAGR